MTVKPELKVDGDLLAALTSRAEQRPERAELYRVLHGPPADQPVPADPLVVVAAYVNELAKRYGLSEHRDLSTSQFDDVAPPSRAMALLRACVPEIEQDADALRGRLYEVVVRLSDEPAARAFLNRSAPVSEVGFRKIAQVYWNLEQNEQRPKLPIRSGQEITVGGRRTSAAIASSDGNRDLAAELLTERTRTRLTGLGEGTADATSGQAFRTKGARLAVLVAEELLRDAPSPLPSASMALMIVVDARGRRQVKVSSIDAAAPGAPGPASDVRRPTPAEPWRPHGRIVVGPVATVGAAYVRRAVDDEIERLWASDGDRRVWLRGGPGHGKSFVARRVMQDALAWEGDDAEVLLVWVDSAGPDAVRDAFSAVLDRVPGLGAVPVDGPDALDARARTVLEALVVSDWRWLVVLDDADATGLIDAGLLPPGTNPLGRVLLTTRARDARVPSHGHVVGVDVFTQSESEAVLRSQVDPGSGGAAALAHASTTDTAALAAAVGHHPLALSVAAATITANAMEVHDWITEFDAAATMDTAADEPDPGGYRHLVGATWRIALDRASAGLRPGVVERAATVAALQAPEGHPSWIWSCPAVLTWVLGEPSEVVPHRMPEAVKRLVGHGVLEMRGPSWKKGALAIHPLAARAVLEVADPTDIADAAAVLTNQWLLRLATGDQAVRAGLRRNLEPLVSRAVPGSAAHRTAQVLLSVAREAVRSYTSQRDVKAVIASYLRRGGATGEAIMAWQLASLADTAEHAGLAAEAHSAYEEAAALYERVLARPSADDEKRAIELQRAGEVLARLGRDVEARQRLSEALTVYARVPDFGSSLDDLVTLVELQTALGDHAARADLLRRIAERVPRMVEGHPRDDIAAVLPVAERMQRLGLDDQLAPLLGDLTAEVTAEGHTDLSVVELRALVRLQAAAGRWADAVETLPHVIERAGVCVEDLVVLAGLLAHLGRSEDAEQVLSHALQARARPDEDGADEDDGAQARRAVATDAVVSGSLQAAGLGAIGAQRFGDAVGIYTELVDFLRLQPRELRGREAAVASALIQRAGAQLRDRRIDDALHSATEAADVYRMLSELSPDDIGVRRQLALALATVSTACLGLGRRDDARDAQTRAVQVTRELPEPEHSDEQLRHDLAAHLQDMGQLSRALDRHDDAAYLFSRLVAIRMAELEAEPGSVEVLRGLAQAQTSLGDVMRDQERFDEAERWLVDALGAWHDLVGRDPGDAGTRRSLAQALTSLAHVQAALGRTDQATATQRRTVDLWREATLKDPGDRDAQLGLADALLLLGSLHHMAGRPEDAVECHRGAVNVADMVADLTAGTQDPPLTSFRARVLSQLASSLRALGRTDEADAAERRAEKLTRADGPD
ncbi:tetratricopeptide repeat protein [Cellulomonas xiejunii]|uniref:Tetratricopeptide repeat protein n=1 Tax=Cellulomonas xiejunii TaxID=2968083 RepID=A0ABY5KLY1_9CELL|nr:tetratricopeptide repeat protein [Cellulomonas xiejunii]MCC2319532.1 tetratricopeptide repeat protein [Cellulomonas xiejunii]UUI71522.1 tetratricopeptide repeat protein [Cellulomonas xiejunii]